MRGHEFSPRGPMHEREADVEHFTSEILTRLEGRSGYPNVAHDDVLTEIRTFLLERLQKQLTEEETVAMTSRLENRITDKLRSIQEWYRTNEKIN